MIDILNGMCERCLMKGVITTLDEAKVLCDVFDRFAYVRGIKNILEMLCIYIIWR